MYVPTNLQYEFAQEPDVTPGNHGWTTNGRTVLSITASPVYSVSRAQQCTLIRRAPFLVFMVIVQVRHGEIQGTAPGIADFSLSSKDAINGRGTIIFYWCGKKLECWPRARFLMFDSVYLVLYIIFSITSSRFTPSCESQPFMTC